MWVRCKTQAETAEIAGGMHAAHDLVGVFKVLTDFSILRVIANRDFKRPMLRSSKRGTCS